MLLTQRLCRDAGCCSGLAGGCVALSVTGALWGKEGEAGRQARVGIGVICQEGPAERSKAENSNPGSPSSAATRSSPPPEAMCVYSSSAPTAVYTRKCSSVTGTWMEEGCSYPSTLPYTPAQCCSLSSPITTIHTLPSYFARLSCLTRQLFVMGIMLSTSS